jgi:hypothetical protein
MSNTARNQRLRALVEIRGLLSIESYPSVEKGEVEEKEKNYKKKKKKLGGKYKGKKRNILIEQSVQLDFFL